MKNITILLILVIATTIKVDAQIPNNGFENWNTFPGYMDPQGWATTNPFGMYTVTQSNDHFPLSIGNYSAKIECDLSYSNACAFVMTGTGGDPQPAFPISGHPTSLTGYYKFLPLNNDSMFIRIQLYLSGNIVSVGQYYQTSTLSNWTSFNIPLSSYTSADHGCIVISTSNLIQLSSIDSSDYICRPNGNSIVYIDNLNFDELITSTQEQTSENTAFRLYPNPASDIVILDLTNESNIDLTLNIYNVIGTLVKSEMVKQNQPQINIEDLSNGVYMVEIKSKDQTLNQRLLIQK
jgi:hypothetical protein